MKKFYIFVVIICLAVFGLGYFLTHIKNEYKPQKSEDQFSKKFMKLVVTDSFSNLLNRVYKSNVKITDSKKDFSCTIFNRGQFLNNFFNTNTNLLKEKDYGFEIKIFGNNDSLNARFEKKEMDSVSYINLPTDVIFGVANQLEKK